MGILASIKKFMLAPTNSRGPGFPAGYQPVASSYKPPPRGPRAPEPTPDNAVDVEIWNMSAGNRVITAHVMGCWLGKMGIDHEANVYDDVIRYEFETPGDAVMFKLYSTSAIEKASHKLFPK